MVFLDFRISGFQNLGISGFQASAKRRRPSAGLLPPSDDLDPSFLRRPSTFLRRSPTALRRSPTSIRRLLSPSASVLPPCANLLLPSASSLRTLPCVQFPANGPTVIGFPRFQHFRVSGLGISEFQASAKSLLPGAPPKKSKLPTPSEPQLYIDIIGYTHNTHIFRRQSETPLRF